MGLVEGEPVQVTGVFPRSRTMTVRAFFPSRRSTTVLPLPTAGAPA